MQPDNNIQIQLITESHGIKQTVDLYNYPEIQPCTIDLVNLLISKQRDYILIYSTPS